MKINEFIKLLQEVQKEHGEIEVIAWPYDGQVGSHTKLILEVYEATDIGKVVEIVA